MKIFMNFYLRGDFIVTIYKRLNYWRNRSDYIGDDILANLINYKKDNTSIEATLTIYTKSGNTAIERIEKWIVPNANNTNYLTKDAYRKSLTLSNKVAYTSSFKRRRWFKW